MMQDTAVLSCDGLAIDLGGRRVLDAVTAVFSPGTVTAVIGPNGAGKSTLLKALAGQIEPAAGEVRLGAQTLAALDPAARGRAIAYLPQTRLADWPLAVRDVVALGRRPHGRSLDRLNEDDDRAIADALGHTDTSHLADRAITALSGGEQARVLIARALAQDAPILIADEPTSGLDPAHQLGLADTLARHAETGGTVVVALHDLSLAARIATCILVLDGGRVLAHAPPADALTPALLARAFGIAARLTEIDDVPLVVTHGLATQGPGD